MTFEMTGFNGQPMTVEIYGARVRQARLLRRMTGRDVMAAMGWTGARQTRLEQSESVVLSTSESKKLSATLRFPLEFLTTPSTSRVTVSDLLFRAPRSISGAERSHLAEFANTMGDVLDLLDNRRRLPALKLPRQSASKDGVRAAAAAVRENMGIQQDVPIGYLTHELERSGVAVVVRGEQMLSGAQVGSMPPPLDKHWGYSCWTGEFNERPLIVTRRIDSWERMRWTLAHETGHLTLHSGGVTDQQEQEANLFANELLAPRDALAAMLPRHVTLHGLYPIKMHWGLSISALVEHLHLSGLIDEQRYTMLRRQLYTRKNPGTDSTWGKLEPGWNEREPERPRLLARWIERVFGTVRPAAIAALEGVILPEDVLAEFLNTQRGAPSANATMGSARPISDGLASVVDFASRRAAKLS